MNMVIKNPLCTRIKRQLPLGIGLMSLMICLSAGCDNQKETKKQPMKKIINTKKAPSAIGPYSQAVWAGDFLFTSGQIALIPETGEMDNQSIETETHRVIKNLTALLEEAGLSFHHVIKVSIFIKDMNDFARINEIYASYLQEPYPARETVEVARLPKDARIEISVVAKRD
jgi:2-iminobutanoate/2-iminopropanoate deaminase